MIDTDDEIFEKIEYTVKNSIKGMSDSDAIYFLETLIEYSKGYANALREKVNSDE